MHEKITISCENTDNGCKTVVGLTTALSSLFMFITPVLRHFFQNEKIEIFTQNSLYCETNLDFCLRLKRVLKMSRNS